MNPILQSELNQICNHRDANAQRYCALNVVSEQLEDFIHGRDFSKYIILNSDIENKDLSVAIKDLKVIKRKIEVRRQVHLLYKKILKDVDSLDNLRNWTKKLALKKNRKRHEKIVLIKLLASQPDRNQYKYYYDFGKRVETKNNSIKEKTLVLEVSEKQTLDIILYEIT